MKLVASRKEHRCDSCGRLIAVGERYWRKDSEQGNSYKEHVNCAIAERDKVEVLPLGFNQNRKVRR